MAEPASGATLDQSERGCGVRVAGLFSGIGGLELPFARRGGETALLSENWNEAAAVLRQHFAGVPLHADVATLDALPEGIEVVTAGFPCTDLSQAGRTAGIEGAASGLVAHVFRLLRDRPVAWLVLENVRNMLVLDRGRAMAFLIHALEELGFRWAYRLVDSRFSGVPQRRHRVLFVASPIHDPRAVLFADEAGPPPASALRDDAFGFYWTEGLRGLGWAADAVPPLKGGSTVGIPSPPAIWLPKAPLGRRLVTPSIEDAEALQGFARGWTLAGRRGRRDGPRWRLVGNAVTVGVADWLAGRLYAPGTVILPSLPHRGGPPWPDAAHGEGGRIWRVDASPWPERRPYRHLT
ncbi:MAG: DNA cytosine methyltransferase, partial [Pseudomonadota bacterium]